MPDYARYMKSTFGGAGNLPRDELKKTTAMCRGVCAKPAGRGTVTHATVCMCACVRDGRSHDGALRWRRRTQAR